MTYPDSYFTSRETWRDWQIEARELMRRACVTRDARVLEIGCGSGGLLRLLSERGARAIGVDTLDTALDLVRERLSAGEQKIKRAGRNTRLLPYPPTPWLIRIAGDDGLPFRDNAFDALIGQHVVEHLMDVGSALRECKRVLRPGGRLALATPNARYPDPAHFTDVNHVRIFSPQELRDVLTCAGFLVEECFTLFPYLSRARALRAFGVIAYRVFQRAPYWATRGRTIIIAARKESAGR